jgi:tetratricopeptide (TPR) repeat protein
MGWHAMTEIQLHLLGPPRLTRGTANIGLRPKEAAFLAYLVYHSPRLLRREHLGALLWPDAPRHRGLRSLSQLQYQIRAKAAEIVWVCRGQSIGVNKIATDVDSFTTDIKGRRLERALSSLGGIYLNGPVGGSEDLEHWREARQLEITKHLDEGLGELAEGGPILGPIESIASCLDYLIDSGIPAPNLLAARAYLHAHQGQLDLVEKVLNRLEREYGIVRKATDVIGHVGASAPLRHGISSSHRALPFVGRHDEVERLKQSFVEAAGGNGNTVIIRGEPGIGKTRLADNFLRRVAISGARIWHTAAHVAHRHVPFASLATLLEDNAPELAPLVFDQPSGTELLHASAGFQDTIAFSRLLIVKRAMQARAESGVFVLSFDDAQWVDEVTAQLLLMVTDMVRSSRIMFLLTHRTTEPGNLPNWIDEVSNPHYIDVGKLSVDEAAELAGHFEYKIRANLPPKLKNEIMWYTAGRPFLLLETLAASVHSSTGADNSITMTSHDAEQLLRRRFRELDDAALWICGIVAVAARPVTVTELQNLAELPVVSLSRHLNELYNRGILEAQTDRITFPHELLREVAYGYLTPIHRTLIHNKMAAYLIANRGNPGVIAQHLLKAADQEGAATYALEAVKNAALEERYPDVEFYCRLALDCGSPALKVSAALALSRHLLKIDRGSEIRAIAARIDAATYPAEAQMLKCLATFADLLGSEDISVDAVVQAVRQTVTAASTMNDAALAEVAGQLLDVVVDGAGRDVGHEILTALQQLVGSSDDKALRLNLSCVSVMWSLLTDGYAQPLKSVEMLKEKVPAGQTALVAFTEGSVKMLAGDLRTAKACLETAAHHAAESGQLGRYVSCMANLGVVLMELGEFDEAEQSFDIVMSSPKASYRLRGLANMAMLRLEAEAYENAIQLSKRLLQANEHSRVPAFSNAAHAIMGLAATAAGDAATVEECYALLGPVMSAPSDPAADTPYVTTFCCQQLTRRGRVSEALEAAASKLVTLKDRDAVASLRVELARCEVLADAGIETAYVELKGLVKKCDTAGAVVLARRARRLMLRTRA